MVKFKLVQSYNYSFTKKIVLNSQLVKNTENKTSELSKLFQNQFKDGGMSMSKPGLKNSNSR